MGQLYDITPFTLLDYPGEMACIAWFAGCNFRCVYCHNPPIVLGKSDKEVSELLDFLKERAGKLTAVVFSGGEPTLYPGLVDVARKARELGYKIKLDTNGTRPQVIKELLAQNLLDYVALDYKCPPPLMKKMVGTEKFVDEFQDSLRQFIAAASKGLKFEVRTTYHTDLMTEDDLGWMISDLDRNNYRGVYYIQNIVSVGAKTIGNIAQPERVFEPEKLPKPKGFTLDFRNFPKA